MGGMTMLDTMHICPDCGQEFLGCKAARYCYDCRRRRTGESAKKRRLCDIGARAKWKKAHEGKEG
jgi:hypothetical protein